MKFTLRFAAWLLLSVCALSLSSCAELALPREQLYPQLAASSLHLGEGVIVNIAPTPSPVLSFSPTETPDLRPTVTPILPPTIVPTEMPAPTEAIAKLDSTCRETTGQLMDGYFKSDVIGRRQHYFIYLPPCYDADAEARYPVVYLLHGIPMDERHWLDEGIVEAADKLFGSGELPPFILVMPHGDNYVYTDTSGGDKSFEGVLVNELIPAIDSRFRTLADPEHRAIGGISRGGVWALEIAFLHPELFDAVGGHSPALSVNRATADYDPLVLAKSASIDQLRIFLDAGDRDWTRYETQALSKVLAERYLPHTYTIGQGDHDYPYWATQVEAYLRFYGAPWKAEKIVERLLAEQPQ
ncbi:Carbohydrate acetyl esterase/feruloyl esterase [Thermoflexales bacterium]|nr:Carbohydrate acetyl esterase/feruloyl esterase [Thermoflexales bacterium]